MQQGIPTEGMPAGIPAPGHSAPGLSLKNWMIAANIDSRFERDASLTAEKASPAVAAAGVVGRRVGKSA
jgi:hypothetical protein